MSCSCFCSLARGLDVSPFAFSPRPVGALFICPLWSLQFVCMISCIPCCEKVDASDYLETDVFLTTTSSDGRAQQTQKYNMQTTNDQLPVLEMKEQSAVADGRYAMTLSTERTLGRFAASRSEPRAIHTSMTLRDIALERVLRNAPPCLIINRRLPR